MGIMSSPIFQLGRLFSQLSRFYQLLRFTVKESHRIVCLNKLACSCGFSATDVSFFLVNLHKGTHQSTSGTNLCETSFKILTFYIYFEILEICIIFSKFLHKVQFFEEIPNFLKNIVKFVGEVSNFELSKVNTFLKAI